MELLEIECLRDKPIGSQKRIEMFISDKPKNVLYNSVRLYMCDSQGPIKILSKTKKISILNDKK